MDANLTLDKLGLRLDPRAMFQVESRRPGQLIVSVEVDGEVMGEARQDVDVLAGMQWVADPLGLALEMLAAHVMPNSPEIADVLTGASAGLAAGTGSPSLQGYQSGPERVDAIVKAVYEELQSRSIRYAQPPASWGENGQQVRTPAEVIGQQIGTCLDLVVVAAACLEQAGIRPLLWVVEGHAFLGYWRVETALDAIAQTDVADVVNRIDLGQIGLVETTSLTAREQPVTFEEAARRPYEAHLAKSLDAVLGVVDVWAARHSRLYPLPARARTADGNWQVVEYRPATHSSPPPAATKAPTASRSDEPAQRAEVPARVSQWKNALLDLSLWNKLINFSTNQSIGLALPGESLGEAEDLLHAKKALSLLPSDHLDDLLVARGVRAGSELSTESRTELLRAKHGAFTDVTGAAYDTRMRGLAYRARTIAEETGANNLYLALGSLVWEHEGKLLRSPLILVPVKLVTRARQTVYRLEIDESGQSTPNYCLLEKLRQVHGLTIPGLANPREDESGVDLDAAFNATRVAIAERGLPYRVEASAHIAILQFAKFRLWKDLDENWQEFTTNQLVKHLVHTPTEPFDDSYDPTASGVGLDELAATCPIPADASQLTAIRDAVGGRTFVLEGPPGTGKSQTITNLLTRAMAEGRRVLFVAEKRAALDVVKRRLDAVGMGPFSLDLHDKGSKPLAVREQIRLAIDHRVDVDQQGLKARSEEVLSAGRSLTRYAKRLHEENGAGLSLYSATTQLLTMADDTPSLAVPASLLSDVFARDVEALTQTLQTLPEVADPARPGPHHPWAFVNIDHLDTAAVTTLGHSATAVDQALVSLATETRLAPLLATVSTSEELDVLVSMLGASQLSLDTLDRTRTPEWRADSATTRHEIHAFVAAAHPGLDLATPEALSLPLADIHAQAQAAAASSWFGRKKRLRAALELLQPGLKAGAVVDLKALPTLTGALVQLRGAVTHLASTAATVQGVDVPSGWNPLSDNGARVVSSQLEWLEWAGRVVDETPAAGPAPFASALRAFIAGGSGAGPEVVATIASLSTALKQVVALTNSSPDRLWAWSSGAGLLTRWQQTSAVRNAADPQLSSLRRWLDLRSALAVMDRMGMADAKAALLEGRCAAEDAAKAFSRGLAKTSVGERRSATGLDVFERKSHERSITRFTRSSHEVQELLKAALPADVSGQRTFAATSEAGRIGALRRELVKQRRGLGVRALIEQYGDLVTQLTPCVLVSPDSLARFFPATANQFDLVVFDEASQIRVADAVGAMGRAKAVVVVGDSKQMPPTSFAEPSGDVDVEPVELVVEDEESILSECVQAGAPRHWLSWHYRSQDEALISFSNLHDYDGRLSSFPAPAHGAADAGILGHGVSLVKVDGQFHRTGKGKLLRTNPIEAEAVVAEIVSRFDAGAPGTTPSIGVVTFNQQQRACIEALIRDRGDDRLVEALEATDEEGLFIKNLENVQGDERDVILFSTGFSVNEKGMLPLNFGPLNRGGGERRLNVAVTRARRQVIVFSSFNPNQLRAEETSSIGVKHLRAYLDLAVSGPSSLPQRAALARGVDRHRDDIADALRDRGYVVTTDVGLSDFRVDLAVARSDAPLRPVAAVLLDSPTWAGRGTVGDRDGLPQDVLSRMLRWNHVARIWLPAWLDDREQVLDDFEAELRQALDAASAPEAVKGELAENPRRVMEPGVDGDPDEGLELRGWGEPTPADAVDTDESLWAWLAEPEADVQPGERHASAGSVFVPWAGGARGHRETLNGLESSGAARKNVRAALIDAVEAEGPIHTERLARLVASSFDLNRVNATRMKAILDQLPGDYIKDTETDVAWPEEMNPTQWSGFRQDKDGHRSVQQISLREIANSMRHVCDQSGGISRPELLRESLALFGFRRVTQGVGGRMESAFEFGVMHGLLAEKNGMVHSATA
ncbi:MAG: DUF4011 domain-containing protein [Humibacillus sp.]|nr:DUF4011 domain-containing protein [Humibacillus sp.]MDN5776807.1 DUF4011 domain-containing protein [Humibacillus sp.]